MRAKENYIALNYRGVYLKETGGISLILFNGLLLKLLDVLKKESATKFHWLNTSKRLRDQAENYEIYYYWEAAVEAADQKLLAIQDEIVAIEKLLETLIEREAQ